MTEPASCGERLWMRLGEQELGGLAGHLLHLGDDGEEAASVGDPLLVEEGLALVELAADRLAAGRTIAPLPVRSVELRWIAMAAATGRAALGVAADDAAGADEAGVGELLSELVQPALVGLESSRICRRHEVRIAMIRCPKVCVLEGMRLRDHQRCEVGRAAN